VNQRSTLTRFLRPRNFGGSACCARRPCVCGSSTCCGVADLLCDFFGDLVNGRVKVAFDVFGKKIRSAHIQADGAAKLFSGGASMIVFKRHPRVNGALSKWSSFSSCFTTWSSMVLVSVMLCVERINFMPSRCSRRAKKSSFSLNFGPTAKIVPHFACSCVKRIILTKMVQGLHLSARLTQSLVLAPQLQQSLALLQARPRTPGARRTGIAAKSRARRNGGGGN